MADIENNASQAQEALNKAPSDKQWYIVTCYSGNERKVQENLNRIKETYGLEDYIFRVIVAEEKVPVLKDNKPVLDKNKEPKYKTLNTYPGYVFIEMIMTDDAWFRVRNCPDVTGIVGSGGGGKKPTPVSGKAMEPVLKNAGMIDETMYERYHVGDSIKIVNGTFVGTDAKIEAIDAEKGTVKVMTVYFGKPTPLELDFSDIMKE